MVRDRATMRGAAVWIGLTVAMIGAGALTGAQDRPAAAPYRLVDNWIQPPPGEQIGGVSWVDVNDTNGLIYAFRRAGNIWTLDANGKFLKAWGHGIAKETH